MRYLIYMFTALLSTSGSHAQTASGLLWKISKDGMPVSYLFGTMHLVCEEDFIVSDQLQTILLSAETLCLEIDLNNEAEMASAVQYMQMNDGTTIESLLGKEKFAFADSVYTSRTGMSLLFVNKLQPLLALSALYPSFSGCAMDGVETKLLRFAKQNGIGSAGLETVAEQAAILSEMPFDVQAQMLWKSLERIDSSKALFENMRHAYRSGDLEKIQSLTESDADFAGYEASFLAKRNNRWMKKLDSLLKQPTFIAVGAAHLPGENGLISLLKKAGFTVTNLPF